MGPCVHKHVLFLLTGVVFGVGFIWFLLNERDPQCWHPAYFTKSHMEYTHKYCGKMTSHVMVNLSSMSPLSPPSENATYTKIKKPEFVSHLVKELMIVIVYCALTHQVLCLTEADRPLLLGLQVLAYSGANHNHNDNIDQDNHNLLFTGRKRRLTELLSSYSIALFYIFVQVVFMIAIVIVGVNFRNEISPASSDPITVLCNPVISHINNIHSFFLQCQLPDQQPYVMLYDVNIAACAVASCLVFLHLCHVFVVSPSFSRAATTQILIEQNFIQGERKLGWRFGFTNCYMVALYSNPCHVFHHGGCLGMHTQSMREMDNIQMSFPTQDIST